MAYYKIVGAYHCCVIGYIGYLIYVFNTCLGSVCSKKLDPNSPDKICRDDRSMVTTGNNTMPNNAFGNPTTIENQQLKVSDCMLDSGMNSNIKQQYVSKIKSGTDILFNYSLSTKLI